MGFLGNLVGGYSEAMLKKEDLKHQEEMQDKRDRVQILQHAIDSGKLTPEAQTAAWEQLEELTGGKKGKKDNEFSLSKIMGRLTGHTGSQPLPPMPGTSSSPASAPGKGGAAGGAGSPQPVPPTRSAAPAARGTDDLVARDGQAGKPSGGVNLGQPPAPPQRSQSPFKTQEQLNQEAVDAQTRLAEAQRTLDKKWRAEDAVEATAAMNKAKTPEEKAIIEKEYGIKMPVQRFQYATVTMPDGSVRPAGYDPATNQFVDPASGLVLEGAVKYSAEKAGDDKKRKQLIADYLRTHKDATYEQAETWAAGQNVRQTEAKGAPQTTISSTIESTPEGPAITKKTETTRGPAGSVPAQRAPKTEHTPTGEGPVVNNGIGKDGAVTSAAHITKPSVLALPWAVPKEGRVAIRKATDDYEVAKTRYNLMKDTEDRIKKDPRYAGQGDKVLLFNHIALARGDKSGLRPTKGLMDEAEKARTIPEGIKVTYDHNFVSGATLSPEQRHWMVQTADGAQRSQADKLRDEQVRYGLLVHVLKDGVEGYIPKEKYKANPERYTELP